MSEPYLRIYASGGTGTNLASKFQRDNNELTGVAYSYFDTSKANVSDEIPMEQRYLLECDGSGSLQKENYEEISDRVLDALQEHPPAPLNVVMFSASGGSGSVFGPSIIRELIRQDKPVIALVVGGLESSRAARNTKNTLATLDNMAANTVSVPIAMHYRCNQDLSLTAVDDAMCHMLSLVELVAAREARSLDGADIRNWLRYTNVTEVSPRLSSLEVYADDSAKEKVRSAISVITLARTHDASSNLGVPTDYHRFGVQDRLPGGEEQRDRFQSLHYLIEQAPVAAIFKRIETCVEEFQQAARARPTAIASLKTGDADDQGFILD